MTDAKARRLANLLFLDGVTQRTKAENDELGKAIIDPVLYAKITAVVAADPRTINASPADKAHKEFLNNLCADFSDPVRYKRMKEDEGKNPPPKSSDPVIRMFQDSIATDAMRSRHRTHGSKGPKDDISARAGYLASTALHERQPVPAAPTNEPAAPRRDWSAASVTAVPLPREADPSDLPDDDDA
jgi:hypothetical protein